MLSLLKLPTLDLGHSASDTHEPLHSRVRQMLQQHILSEFETGARFYSERELTAFLKVSHMTVRRVMLDLANDGYLVPSSRRGFFVRKNQAKKHVGVFVSGYRSGLNLDRVDRLAEACREQEMELHVYHLRPDDQTAAAIKMIRNLPTDERIVLSGMTAQLGVEFANELRSRRYKFVFSNEVLLDYPAKSVGINEEVGIDLIVDHLVMLGHERMLFLVNEPMDLMSTRVRAAMVQKKLEALGNPLNSLVSCETRNWANSFDAAYAQIGAILTQKPWPTAICPLSGIGAWAVLKYCLERGIRIPRDLSLISYDMLPGNDVLPIALTALSHSESEIAHEILSLLWSNESESSRKLINPSLVIKASTGPAPKR